MRWFCSLTALLCLSAAFAAVKLKPVEEPGGESYKLRCTLDVDGEWPLGEHAEIVFDAGTDGACYAARFDEVKASFVRRDSRGAETLLAVDARPPIAEVPLHVTLCRDRWRMRLIVNGEVWLTAFDDRLPSGGLAVGGDSDKFRFKDLSVQGLEQVWFTDDFMRASDAKGEWTPRSGRWETSGVSDADAKPDKRPDPSLSANPFAYRVGRPTPAALSTAGHWFWDTYRLAASVRAAGDGEVGLTFYLQDPDNYLALRWTAGGAAGHELRLVAVKGGQAKVLASADGGFANDQWYRLAVEVVDGQITASLDHQPKLTAHSDLFGQGQVGLWANGVTFADWDDVEVESTEDLLDTFGQDSNGRWLAVNGEWSEDLREDAPRNAGVREVSSNDTCFSVTGAKDWSGYRVSTVCHAPAGGAVGVVCSYLDPNNNVQLRWGDGRGPAAYRNKLQLVRVREGKPFVLGEIAVAFRPDLWHELSLENQRGFIRARVGGAPVFEAYEPDLVAGKAGLLGAGSPVDFDEAEVRFLEPEPKVQFAHVFTEDSYMTQWASPAGAWWVNEAAKRGGVVWHRGDFYGDSQVAVHGSMLGGAGKMLRLILAGDGQRADSGYSLVVETRPDGKKAVAQIIVGQGQPQSEAVFDLAEVEAVRFARRGRFLLAYADDTCVLGYYDRSQTPPGGNHVGVTARGGAVDLTKVDARSDNSYDTTFYRAPVEWWISKGVWETINRWKCDPRWSFFGGYNDTQPLIWSKDDYQGDIQLEAYMGIKMDLTGPPYYLHPSDLCITVHGDGKDVLSGTNFLFAARNNTCSVLYSGGKQVAFSDRPEARFETTQWDSETQGNKFHRHWFHVVLRKAEGRIVCSVDEKTVFDVADPAPGGHGKVGLYCVNNGVMVARVKVWYQQLAPREPFPDIRRMLATADTGSTAGDPYQNDFEQGIGAFKPEDERVPVMLARADGGTNRSRCLAVTNLLTGGTFGVRAVGTPYNLADRPVISFRCKLPQAARVNLYALARGVWHVVKLSGSEKTTSSQRYLGAIEGVAADGGWHAAKFNLNAALSPLYPGAAVQVEKLVFGMMEPDPYLAAAFGV
ncbi:MAG: hypothetical protein HYU66_15970, partial [Armatimonadetes bacterium]|nr:hypothetical protein [Armatimonadota bacterium]